MGLGSLVNGYAYEPYGNVAGTSFESVPNSHRYGGQLGMTDEGDGVVFARWRHYLPGLGRFTSKDPINVVASNRYVYASGDPVNLTDPLGLQFVPMPDPGFWEFFFREMCPFPLPDDPCIRNPFSEECLGDRLKEALKKASEDARDRIKDEMDRQLNEYLERKRRQREGEIPTIEERQRLGLPVIV